MSCGGGKKEEISMKPETTSISGDLSDCYEVVDEDCIVKLKDGKLESFATWRIKIRRTDNPLPFDEGVEVLPYGTFCTDGSTYYNAGFGLEIMDEDNYTLDEFKATAGGLQGVYSSEDIKQALKLKAGEECTIRWSVNEKLLETESPLTFRISSAYDIVEGSGRSSSRTSSSDDYDIDDAIDDYNKVLDATNKALDASKKAVEASRDIMDAFDD